MRTMYRPLATLSTAFIFALFACNTMSPDQITEVHSMHPSDRLTLEDPSEQGSFTPASFLYGSPHHPRRWEYEDRTITTKPVDLSMLFHPGPATHVQFVDPGAYYDRISYDHWGFTEDAIPVNGKVWYPSEGDGPFPLIVVIHGNHDPYSPSEFGYDYLGELFASRGMIFASLDQNMLNGRTDGRENDARAILLLEHIKQILSWSDDPGTPLFGRIDQGNIGLIGHSRGGEAVVLATIYNRLDRAPEDGSIELNYGFSIKGVVALSPVADQYQIAQRELGLGDTHFLLLHGSADGDVTVDMGLRFFNRFHPQYRSRYFSFWIYGANHAQFNSDWATHQDPFPVWGSDLLSPAEQQGFASTLVSAFYEFAFDREPEYETFLRDYRTGLHWLPSAFTISNVRSSDGEVLAHFEEDVDLETSSLPEWKARASQFRLWTERVVAFDTDKHPYERRPSPTRTQRFHQQSHALHLEWEAFSGTYRLESHGQPLRGSTLSLEIAGYALPKDAFVDFTIRLEGAGQHTEIRFGDNYALSPIPGTHVLTRGYSYPEILQHVEIPLGELGRRGVNAIEFVFDRIESGSVTVDNITIHSEKHS